MTTPDETGILLRVRARLTNFPAPLPIAVATALLPHRFVFFGSLVTPPPARLAFLPTGELVVQLYIHGSESGWRTVYTVMADELTVL